MSGDPTEIKRALKVAADALQIASDWGLPDVQAHPPGEWNLDTVEEKASEGWCSTAALSNKLRELAK